jgi:hypothetical protein
MLSVVGMLNYMGNQEVPMCTSLDEQYSNQMPLEQYRMARVSEAKNQLLPQQQHVDEDWSMDVNTEENDLRPAYDEYAFSGDLVPAKPSQVLPPHQGNGILNRTSSGITLEEAYVAFDMRESYLQRHASPMALYSDTTDLYMKDFATKTSKVWKTNETALYPEYSSCASQPDQPDETLY